MTSPTRANRSPIARFAIAVHPLVAQPTKTVLIVRIGSADPEIVDRLIAEHKNRVG